MGTTRSSEHTMVATQLLISVCVAGLARAAPQLGLPAPTRVNQQVIVTDVVTALQPSIAQAVADALRGLGSSSSFTSSSSSTGFASGGSSSGSSSGSSFSAGATGAIGAAGAVEGAKAEYNYEFKVADEAEQTYISANENRDGNEVTGTYSYVDPNGDLVTVNYQAGPMGYTQTLDKQVGVVDIVQRPVKNQASISSSQQSGSSFGSQSSSSFGSQSGSSFSSQSGSSFGSQSGSSFGSQSGFSSSSSGLSQSSLIAQILAVLEPQISVAVNNAVRQQ